MITLKQVNDQIKANGGSEELVRGDGYLYFCGGDADFWEEQGVYGVRRLNDLSVAQWVDEWRHRRDENARLSAARQASDSGAMRFTRTRSE